MKCKGHKSGKGKRSLRWHVYRDTARDQLGFVTRRLVCCATPGEALRKYLSIARRIQHGEVLLVGRTGVLDLTAERQNHHGD